MDDQNLPAPVIVVVVAAAAPGAAMLSTGIPAPQPGLQICLADLQLRTDLVEAVCAVEVAG